MEERGLVHELGEVSRNSLPGVRWAGLELEWPWRGKGDTHLSGGRGENCEKRERKRRSQEWGRERRKQMEKE